jgi:hypothetical protein
MQTTKPLGLEFWLPAVLLLMRSVVLGYLIGAEVFDARFFTYLNYLLLTFGFLLLVISARRTRLWCLYVLPPLWGTTVFVALAIVVIIQLNDGVFLRTTVFNNGDRSVAGVHTGDWLLHQLPFIEILLVLLALRSQVTASFRSLWAGASVLVKVLYTLYFHTAALALLSFYMVNIDFRSNYPTPISSTAVWLLTVGLALAVEAILFLLLLQFH